MTKVKVPFLLKLIVFTINFILLINILILPQNIFWISNIIPLLILSIYSVLFYYVLKNNKLAIKIFWFFSIIALLSIFYLLYVFYIAYSFFFLFEPFDWFSIYKNPTFLIIFNTILFFIIILNLYFVNKNINLGLGNLNEKLITEKNQSKNFIISLIVSVIFLLVFRFWYYTKEIDIKDIDDSFFVTKYQNIDIKAEDNLYNHLKNFEYTSNKWFVYFKEVMFDCLYKNICNLTLENFQLNISKIKNHEWLEIIWFNPEKIINNDEINDIQEYLKDNIDILYIFENEELFNNHIDDLINIYNNKKYYKTDIDQIISFTNFIQFNNELKYKILYYINNNQEEKSIEILQAQINTLYTMLEWDSILFDKLVSITYLNILFENIEFIIENYELSDSSKNIFIWLLNREINKKSLNYSFIIEYSYFLLNIKNMWLNDNTNVYNHKYTKKWIKEIHYYRIINNWELPESIIKKYENINYFKSNILGQKFFLDAVNSSFISQYNRLNELENFRKELIFNLEK
jgi:hypothetical protein